MVCMSQRLIGVLMGVLSDNPEKLAIQSPPSNDPLQKILKQMNIPGLKKLGKSRTDAKLNFKLKTRIFIPNLEEIGGSSQNQDSQLFQYVRCTVCHASLLRDIAIKNFDENIVISQYEPLDKESLVTQFCEILKAAPQINKELLGSSGKDNPQDSAANNASGHGGKGSSQSGMKEFIEQTEIYAKRNSMYLLSEMLHKFRNKMEVEIKNLQNKLLIMGSEEGQAEKRPVDCEQEIYLQLLQKAEEKYHERVR